MLMDSQEYFKLQWILDYKLRHFYEVSKHCKDSRLLIAPVVQSTKMNEPLCVLIGFLTYILGDSWLLYIHRGV